MGLTKMRCIECNIILSPEEDKRGRCELCIELAEEATDDFLERIGDEKFHEMRDERLCSE